MGKVVHYPLRDIEAVTFTADTTVEALNYLVAWLDLKPDISILAISFTPGDNYEEVTLFYE